MKTKAVYILMILLLVEKTIQHAVVSLAFYFNWSGIHTRVAVSSSVLMILGAIVTVLSMLCLWGLIAKRAWSLKLVIGLAIFDIIGEFAAQGRIDIVITLSFVVATLLLILTVIYLRQVKPIVWLVGLLLLLLVGCISIQNPLTGRDWEKIEQQVRDSVEKDFPLPEQVTIQSHIGDDLRYTTELSVDEVIAFYRDAYAQEGYIEQAGSDITVDQATLSFKEPSKKDVWLEVKQTQKKSQVCIRLKSATP